MTTPLILTVTLDQTSQSFFNQQRKQYFPAHLNVIDAHLTLFHHLPDNDPAIIQATETIAAQQQPIELTITKPVHLGKGVAYKIESKVLMVMHKKLQKEWLSFLTPQDRQGLWPHITIQNKVSLPEAKQTLRQVNEAFAPFTAFAIGFSLWRYLNGPWQLYRQFVFDG